MFNLLRPKSMLFLSSGIMEPVVTLKRKEQDVSFDLCIALGVLRGQVVARWTGDQPDGGSNLAWVLGMFHNLFRLIVPGDPCPDMTKAVERDVKP